MKQLYLSWLSYSRLSLEAGIDSPVIQSLKTMRPVVLSGSLG